MYEYTLRNWYEAPPTGQWEAIRPEPAAIRRAMQDALSLQAPRRLDHSGTLLDPIVLPPPDRVDERCELWRLLMQRRLVLYRRLVPRLFTVSSFSAHGGESAEDAVPLADLAEPDPQPEQQQELDNTPPRPTWIEIALVDADDNPLPNRPYRLVLSDHVAREGRTGPDGVIRFDDVVAGLCTLVLPTQDEQEWAPQA